MGRTRHGVLLTGLFPDDGARVACVALAWFEGEDLKTIALPFDQGERDKTSANPQLDMFAQAQDPNLSREEWQQLLDWLQTQRIVYHNAEYDQIMMHTGTREWAGVDLSSQLEWCTMLIGGVLDPTEPRGLDVASKRAGFEGKQGVEALQGWLQQRKYKKYRYDLAPWDLVEDYVTSDVEMAAHLCRSQKQRVAELGWEDRVRRELDLCNVLYWMERRGLAYDDTGSREAGDLLLRKAQEIEDRMPFKADIGAAKKYFFGEQGLTPLQVTEKGAPSLNEETLREYVKQGTEWAQECWDVMKMRRTVSMHYHGYAEKMGQDGRLRTRFKQGHVRSGRMSVERVQLQALPKKDKNIPGVPGVRSFIQSAPGTELWSLDFSQAELRVASKYAGCQRMLDLINNGGDAHGVTNEQVLGVSRDDPLWKEKRDIAKRLNFGAIFQIGAEKFQATLSKLADLHLPIGECMMYVNNWRQLYPEYGVAYRKAEKMAQDKGYVRLLPNTPYEVQSHFAKMDYPNTAWNRIVQGSLAEFFKLFLVGVERYWPGMMNLCIHDSIELEIPIGRGVYISQEIQAFGAHLATELFRTPMAVDADEWSEVDRGVSENDQYTGSSGGVNEDVNIRIRRENPTHNERAAIIGQAYADDYLQAGTTIERLAA